MFFVVPVFTAVSFHLVWAHFLLYPWVLSLNSNIWVLSRLVSWLSLLLRVGLIFLFLFISAELGCAIPFSQDCDTLQYRLPFVVLWWLQTVGFIFLLVCSYRLLEMWLDTLVPIIEPRFKYNLKFPWRLIQAPQWRACWGEVGLEVGSRAELYFRSAGIQ